MSDAVSISLTVYDESVSIFADLNSHSVNSSTHYDRSTSRLREHIEEFQRAVQSTPPEGSLRFGDQNLWFKLTLEPAPRPDPFESVVRVEIQDLSFRVQYNALTTPEKVHAFAEGLLNSLDDENAFPAILQVVAA